jgi:hypothetical protein
MRCVVIATTRYPLYRRLGELQGRSWGCVKPFPNWDSIPGPSIHPIASRYTDWAIPARPPYEEFHQMSENIHEARETRDSIAFVPQRDADNE